jgi:hypothetical protein
LAMETVAESRWGVTRSRGAAGDVAASVAVVEFDAGDFKVPPEDGGKRRSYAFGFNVARVFRPEAFGLEGVPSRGAPKSLTSKEVSYMDSVGAATGTYG